jgi:TRAP-type C4-dicarboxylate transport system substrate-binding protein
MRLSTIRVLAPVLVVILVGVPAAGCSIDGEGGGADKAGGSDAPSVLRLAVADDADQPDARFARDFAARVSRLSDGALRVRIEWDAAGQDSPDYERRIADLVSGGRFDLGWMGARAWDRMDVSSFQALQAPFLVTDHELLGRIATGPLGSQMLAGLDDHGFVGLALVPERLRYIFGVRNPLASPDDFAGARVRVRPSRATDALIRALGATPIHISGDAVADAVAQGKIDGAEASLGTNSADEGETVLTANLPLFPKMLTLFAASEAFDRLDADQRGVLRKAAQETGAYAAAHPPSEIKLMGDFCLSGPPVRAVTASPEDLVALRRATRPVYADMKRDPETAESIAGIRALKAAQSTARVAAAPPACSQKRASVGGRELPASRLNGTYHWRVTSAGARDAARLTGGSVDARAVGTIGKMTLRDGEWVMGDTDPEDYSGTYEIKGHHLVFDWSGSILAFRVDRLADGALDLTPIPPMDPGDAAVWSGGDWRRVGPPVREIP